jgi:hypothetical protein
MLRARSVDPRRFPIEIFKRDDAMITAAAAAKLLLLFLPFLLSLRGEVAMPKLLCLITCVLALLLSVEPYAAVLPWSIGMAIAIISVRERMYRRRTI